MKEVCLVYDIGRRNKKYYVFDRNYQLILSDTVRIIPVTDEDGDEAENLLAIKNWVLDIFEQLNSSRDFKIIAINASAYASTWVHLDREGKVVAPLYSAEKKIPYTTLKAFNEKYQNQSRDIFLETHSPKLGMMNAGLQLYWLKHQKVDLFKKVAKSIPLAQFPTYLLTGKTNVGLSSIGCHSAMWNFEKNTYHSWLEEENLSHLLDDPTKNESFFQHEGIFYGIGIHNSSSSLTPYIIGSKKPFILLSTGAWTITFNPFCGDFVDSKQLEKDALNYLRYDSKVVKGSRLFSGNEHKRVVKHLAEHFEKDLHYYRDLKYDPKIIQSLRKKYTQYRPENTEIGNYLDCPFMERNINDFQSFEVAYHQFIMDLVAQQISSIRLTFGKNIPEIIFVDGGFSQNDIFMSLLDEAFFNKKVYANKESQATALGAALVIEQAWKPETFTLEKLTLQEY